MMNKNNNISLILKTLSLPVLLPVGNCVCYANEPVAGSAVIPIQTVLTKFCMTMGSVLLSLVVIWIGLNLYKNYYLKQQQNSNKKELYGDTMDTPKNIEDAVITFIDKNRL